MSQGRSPQVSWRRLGAVIGTSVIAFSWMAEFPAAAEPANDGVVPTANYSPQCMPWTYTYQHNCRADNATHSYYMDSNAAMELETPDRAEVNAAMSRWDDNTDVDVVYDSSPVFSGAGETDVIVQEGSFGAPDDISGVTWCEDPQDDATYLCDQHYVRMRGAGTITETISGHEIGHTLGFVHPWNWAPSRTPCDAITGIMRSSPSCGGGAALGDAVKNNANWVY